MFGPRDAGDIVDEWDVPAQIKAASIPCERATEPTHVVGSLNEGDGCPIACRSKRSREARGASSQHHNVAALSHSRHGARSEDDLQAASGPEVTILAHVPRPSVPSLAAAGLAVLLITAGSASATTGGAVSSSGVRWTVLVIAAVLIAAGGLAIVKSMWGMRAPLKRGATETTETLWLLLPLILAVALVVFAAQGIS